MSTDKTPIFITGRFRSGTSFLWQLFDQLDDYCAWYEPLHPQLLTAIHYVKPKEDHVGIKDYWSTYRQHPAFSKNYSSDFATQKLYLESKHDYHELESYIKHLILLSGSQTPVLQFNRVDLRLGWLRAKFPQARIIHIERNPLQLYFSQRKHIAEENLHQADYWDAYELMPWCHALYQEFPFLLDSSPDNHAFYRFYALYQLSKLNAAKYANQSINLDVDVFQSDAFIAKLNQVVPLTSQQQSQIKAMTHVPEQKEFAADYVENMASIMTTVDLKLADAGLTENFPHRSLIAIQFQHPEFWAQFNGSQHDLLALQEATEKLAKEVHRIHQENQYYLREIDTLSGHTHQLDGLPESVLDVDKVVLPTKKTADSLLKYFDQLTNAMTQILAINAYLDPEFYALKDAADAKQAQTETDGEKDS